METNGTGKNAAEAQDRARFATGRTKSFAAGSPTTARSFAAGSTS